MEDKTDNGLRTRMMTRLSGNILSKSSMIQ